MPQLQSLQQQADQIQPVKTAQIGLVTLNGVQSSLDDQLEALINQLSSEIDDESRRLRDYQQLWDQIQSFNEELPGLNSEELKDRRDNLVPMLRQHLTSLTTFNERQFVAPMDTNDLQDQLDQLVRNIEANLMLKVDSERQTGAMNQWNSKKQHIQSEISSIESDARPILDRYSSNQSQPSSVAHEDLQRLNQLDDRIKNLNDDMMLQIRWVLNLDGMSEEARQVAVDDLKPVEKRLKQTNFTCSDLSTNLSEDFDRLDNAKDQYAPIMFGLEMLEQNSSNEDPAWPIDNDSFLQRIQELNDQLQQLSGKLKEVSKIKPDEDINIGSLQYRIDNLFASTKQRKALKQMEASELENEVGKIRKEIDDTIDKASSLLLDPNASIESLQEAASLLDGVQPQIRTLHQLNTNQSESPTNENAHLRQEISSVLDDIQPRWTEKRQEVVSRMESLLQNLSQRLAFLVTEGQQLLVNNRTHPDQFNEHANRLR